MICEVIIDETSKKIDRPFDYLIPSTLENIIQIGMRVEIDFNHRIILGFVTRFKEQSDFPNLKSIIRVIDPEPIISQDQLALANYLKAKYFMTSSQAFNLVIPGVFKYKPVIKINVIKRQNLPYKLNNLLPKATTNYTKEFYPFLKEIKEAVNKGDLELIQEWKSRRLQQVKVYFYVTSIKTSSKSMQELLTYIKEKKKVYYYEIKNLGFSLSSLNNLIKKGAIKVAEEEVMADITKIKLPGSLPNLNAEQTKALNAISLSSYQTYLLYGVTGSGKTLVYLRLIEKVLNSGKEAIILVPEIVLTTQLAAYFAKLFGQNLAIIHSKLTATERFSEYTKISRGLVKVVLGPRSAIFAQFHNLGIIIIDEEQEGSYYQENWPNYDARELASFIAKKRNIPLLLGSATPRIVSFYKAIHKEYQLLQLPKRATGQIALPSQIVDMRLELKNKNISTISKTLGEAISTTLANGEQVMLFLNRRGYASAVMCRDCGHIIKCPHCDLPLTYHKNYSKLVCHICGYEMPNVSICPKCQSKRIRYVGLGTEKICQDVARLFPLARIIRVDSDSVGRDYNYFYEKIINKEVDIIIGTQMIAKGLDFPNVTLVGVLNADISLYYPSYDANEVTYDILEQVSGRSGRHKDGKVILQTYNPDNAVISLVAKHDYLGFYNVEIKKRELLNNPPFSKIIRATFSAKDSNCAKAQAENFIKDLPDNLIVLGPSEAIYFKVNDTYNYDVYIKYLKDDDIKILNTLVLKYNMKLGEI